VTITATDPAGETISVEFIWTVDNIAPVVTTELPNVSFDDGSDVSLPTAASFADLDGDTLTFTATGLPEGLSIDNASLGEGGNAALELSMRVGEPTTIDIGSLTSDPDGDDVLIFSVDGELPPGLTLDLETGVITGRPSVASAEPYEFRIRVDDGEGGISFATVILEVTQDGFIIPDDVSSSDPLVDGVDPYEFLEGQPIDIQRYFRDRALDNADEFGRMFGDRDFRGGMVAVSIPGHGSDTPYMVVEAVAYDHHLSVALTSTFPLSSDVAVRSWDITQVDGTPLPAWLDWSNGTDFMQVQRPLDTKTIQLKVKAILDNGRTATISVEIDLRTGTVTQLGEAYAIISFEMVGDFLSVSCFKSE